MKKSAHWAPAPNLTIMTVEQHEADWAVSVSGGDHAAARFAGFDPIRGIVHIVEHSAIFRRREHTCRRSSPAHTLAMSKRTM
jgi:hypothetical protein